MVMGGLDTGVVGSSKTACRVSNGSPTYQGLRQLTLPADTSLSSSTHSTPSAFPLPAWLFSNIVSTSCIPMLPLPRPSFCAAAFRLCSCRRLVALAKLVLELPATAGAIASAAKAVSAVAVAEGGNANVVEVDVDVVGAAVGVTGEVVTVGGNEGDVAVWMPVVDEMLETDPAP